MKAYWNRYMKLVFLLERTLEGANEIKTSEKSKILENKVLPLKSTS